MKEFLATPADAGSRLDVVVASLYPQYTRSSLELLFDKGMIYINGQAAKPSHKVRQADAIEVDELYLQREPTPIDLPILYEDKDVIVIDKPAEILTHSKGALNLEPSVASFIKSKISDKTLVGNRAGIVHRLDRPTSGVIIAAKTAAAQKFLQRQFSQRKVKKTYIAIVQGVPEPEQAIIDAPITRNPKKPQTFAARADGKPAQTQYEVLTEGVIDKKPAAKVKLKPLTGRTHQLRVHMAYLGHPIIGDIVYGHKNGGLMLHAAELELTLPGGKRRRFKSKLPARFEEFVKNA